MYRECRSGRLEERRSLCGNRRRAVAESTSTIDLLSPRGDGWRFRASFRFPGSRSFYSPRLPTRFVPSSGILAAFVPITVAGRRKLPTSFPCSDAGYVSLYDSDFAAVSRPSLKNPPFILKRRIPCRKASPFELHATKAGTGSFHASPAWSLPLCGPYFRWASAIRR
jgi:hypothetical protein